jgi:hypothetical protein
MRPIRPVVQSHPRSSFGAYPESLEATAVDLRPRGFPAESREEPRFGRSIAWDSPVALLEMHRPLRAALGIASSRDDQTVTRVRAARCGRLRAGCSQITASGCPRMTEEVVAA